MIEVQEAINVVLNNTQDLGTEKIPLSDSLGRVLREDISADRDFPPYHRVTMDGIAIYYSDYEKGVREFKVAGVAAAGSPQMELNGPNSCLEVMTGAIMPNGVDTVIQYEHLEIENGIAKLLDFEEKHKQNIHFKGIDRKAGDCIIKAGTKIGSPEIGVMATVGKAMVEVSKLPKTLIISTGDELVDIDKTPLPHQIRRSNVFRLKTVLKKYNIEVNTAHLLDDYDQIVAKLKQYLVDYDLIMLSGGVSKGKFDFLPEALNELGVEKLFHRIAQRPGKPFWFGRKENTTVFAFPGNPVSSFMSMQQYFTLWLEKTLQVQKSSQPYGILTDDVTFKPDLTYFLEVKIEFSNEGKVLAHPVKGNGSGDLANLVDADAFIILPKGKNEFYKGEVYPLLFFRDIL